MVVLVMVVLVGGDGRGSGVVQEKLHPRRHIPAELRHYAPAARSIAEGRSSNVHRRSRILGFDDLPALHVLQLGTIPCPITLGSEK